MTTKIIKDYYQNDNVAQTYDRERFASLPGRLFDRLEKRALIKMIDRVRAEIPAPSVLDVPCGTGRITELLLSRGLTVTGADISREMIDQAKIKCQKYFERISFQTLDLDSADLPKNQYDLVACIRMLHHLNSESRKGVFKSLAKLSKRYVLVNISLSSPFYRLRRKVKRWLGQGVSRESSTWLELSEETSQAGLQVVSSGYVWRYMSEDLIVLLVKNK